MSSDWTPEEDKVIFDTFLAQGPRWSLITIPNRTVYFKNNREEQDIIDRFQVIKPMLQKYAQEFIRAKAEETKIRLTKNIAVPYTHIIPRANETQEFQVKREEQRPLTQGELAAARLIQEQNLHFQSLFRDPIIHQRLVDLQFEMYKQQQPDLQSQNCMVKIMPFQNLVDGVVFGIPILKPMSPQDRIVTKIYKKRGPNRKHKVKEETKT